jgi:hypothetical protein
MRTGVKKVFDEIEIFQSNEAEAQHPANRNYIIRLNVKKKILIFF